MSAIELKGVKKSYGDVTALNDVDIEVGEGEVFGFLGPNGAGKSTTIDLLLDYLTPDEGSVEVLGMDAADESLEIRRRTGVLPEDHSAFRQTTGREHLEFAVQSRGVADSPDDLLERVGLDAEGSRKATEYSKGMLQRLALAMALTGEPDLLILDEPSGGLDPHGVRMMREIVEEEAERGATVFFSSHILEQVEAVADRVGIVDEGRVVDVDTIEGLRRKVGGAGEIQLTLDGSAEEAARFVESSVERAFVESVEGDGLTVRCPPSRKANVVDAARRDGARVLDIETDKQSLENLFIARTEDDR